MTQTRRNTTKPATDRIVRIYEVILFPDDQAGEVLGAYDPFSITLGYPVDKVPDDPNSDAVKAEALKVAIKTEIREGRMDADSTTTLALSSLRLKASKLYRAADTFEAGAARR